MDRWEKFIKKISFFLGIFTLFHSPSHAQYFSPYQSGFNEWDCLDQHFEVGADFLYWKPCITELDYAAVIQSENGRSTVSYKGFCHDWEPAYRIYIGLPQVVCDWDIDFYYTRVESCQTEEAFFDDPSTTQGIASPLIHPDLQSDEFFEFAKGNYDLSYQEWDLLFSYDISCLPCHSLKPFVGAAGIYLKQHLNADFFPSDFDEEEEEGEVTPTEIKWNNKFWGVGITFGTEYIYAFNYCFSIFFKASGTILCGKSLSENEQELAFEVEAKDDDCWYTIPGYHLGTGMIYKGCLCGTDYALKVGYELINWFNMPNPRVFTSSGSSSATYGHSSSSSTRSLGFHGLVTGVSIIF